MQFILIYIIVSFCLVGFAVEPMFNKQFAGYMLLDSAGTPVPLSNLKYTGSVKFDLNRFGASGLPIVISRYNFSYVNTNSDTIFTNLNNNFTDAWPFYNGRAVIKKGMAYALINVKGEYLTSNLYDFIGEFSEGVAVVGVGKWDNGEFTGLTGYIDSTGKALSQIAFQKAEPFKNGKAKAYMNNKLFEFDFNGNIAKVPVENNIHTIINNYTNGSYTLSQNKYGYFEFVTKVNKKNEYFLHPCRVNDKWTYCDSTLQPVFSLQFDYAFEYSNNRALVSINNKYTFIDNKGHFITTERFDNADPFSENIALVQVADKFSYIGLDGKYLFPLNYKVRKFIGNIPKMEKLGRTGKLYTLANAQGKPITEWLDKIDDFVEGKARVRRNDGLLSTIDISGKQDTLWQYNIIHEGTLYRIIENSGKYAIFDKTTDTTSVFVEPYLFFPEGLSFAEKDGKWGYINNTGKVIINFEYEYTANFSEGYAVVGKKGVYYPINKQGQSAFELTFTNMYNFTEGLAAVCNGKKWGYINNIGKIAIPFKYRAVSSFNEGLAAVKKGRYWGYINKTGTTIIPSQFINAGPFIKGVAWVRQGTQKLLINKAGKPVNADNR